MRNEYSRVLSWAVVNAVRRRLVVDFGVRLDLLPLLLSSLLLSLWWLLLHPEDLVHSSAKLRTEIVNTNYYNATIHCHALNPRLILLIRFCGCNQLFTTVIISPLLNFGGFTVRFCG